MKMLEQINAFSVKWLDKFNDPGAHYLELVESQMGDECFALGFNMDCGEGFSQTYGNAATDSEALRGVIDQIDDVYLLGSAIFSRWRYFNHWAYSGEEILEPKNRAWFQLALRRLAILAGEDLLFFEGTPKRMRIVSNNICYGPPPAEGEEVEQHLTINSDGRIWFSSYNFGFTPGKYDRAASNVFSIRQDTAEYLLNAVANYFRDQHEGALVTDIGDWSLEIVNTEDKAYKFQGSLCVDSISCSTDLSSLIRNALKMDNLFAFDGNYRSDLIDKVEVKYRRQYIGDPDNAELFEPDCTENIILDRTNKTLKIARTIGDGCVIEKKYYHEQAIEELLNRFDSKDFLDGIQGDSDDAIDDANVLSEYRITVDLHSGEKQSVKGEFYSHSLPERWEEFARAVKRFVDRNDRIEMLMPYEYQKTKRRKSDYMYCSVVFDGGYNSYYYISDDDSIEIGDRVVVPAGKDNHLAIVEVDNIEYFAEDNVPLPLEKTKHIIRKCSEDEFSIVEEN